jgi:hypothetical protein
VARSTTTIANALHERHRFLRARTRVVMAALEDAQPRDIRQQDAKRPDITVLPQDRDDFFEPATRLVQPAGLERGVGNRVSDNGIGAPYRPSNFF